MEEFTFITLRCKDCEADNCQLCPIGTWVSEDNKRGCTRKVTQEEKDKFNHYKEEVLPFLHLYKNKETEKKTYIKIIDFLNKIYNKPLGNKIGKSGKIVKY